MPFEFLMLSFVAHEFVVFSFNKGYSWLLSFSFFLFPAHVCFAVRLLMPFEFPMLSFVAHEFFMCFLSKRLLMTFEFLKVWFPAHVFFCFFSKATHAFWISHVVNWFSKVFSFFLIKATHNFRDSHDFCFCCSWFIFFQGYSWLLSFSCVYSLLIFLVVLARILMTVAFLMLSFVAHEFLVCVFLIGYSWFLSCSCAFCYSWCFF